VRDRVVPPSRGWSERDYYRFRNGCSRESSASGIDECVDYRACAAGLPVTWCEHDEPTYDDTNHGWPSFASRAVARFVDEAVDPAPDVAHSLLSDSGFDSPAAAASWQRFFIEPARGQTPELTGAGCVEIEAPGQEGWAVQIAQRGLLLELGHGYTLDFRAWSSAPVVLRTKLGKAEPPYSEYWANRFELSATPRRFRAELHMVSPNDEAAEVAFHMGGGHAKETPVTVCVDDVYLSDPSYERRPKAGGNR
jgi:endoglucanase